MEKLVASRAKEAEDLKSEVEELGRQRASLQASINALKRYTAKVVEDMSRKLESRLTQLDSKVTEELAEWKSRVGDTLSRAQGAAESVGAALDGLVQQSLDAGKALGKYEALSALHTLIATGEGGRHEVLTSVYQVNGRFSAWLKNNPIENVSIGVSLNMLLGDLNRAMQTGT